MDFLKKIQTWLAGASTDVEEFDTHIESEKEKYSTSTVKKAVIFTASVIVLGVAILYFLF